MILRKLSVLFVNFFIVGAACGQISKPAAERAGVNSLVKFTENKGQWDNKVLFRAQLDGGVLFLEKNCFTYNFYEKEKMRKNHMRSSDEKPTKEEMLIRVHAFRVTLKNSLPTVDVSSKIKSSNYSNFFIGKNPARWASKAYDYSTVYYQNIYSGIDLEVNGKDNSLKYNFIVRPGADAKNICMQYYGVSSIKVENGSLRITTPITVITEQPPYAYQEENGMQKKVNCNFVLNTNEVTFSLGQNYNPALPLIIDPTLIFCSYSGSVADNFGMTATYDNQGNFYAGGTAFNQGYPTTPGAFDSTYNGIVQDGRTDVVITKYNSTGTNLIYSTYLGGALSTEIVSSIIVNSNNELMLLGTTGSFDFPVTPTAFDTSFNGGTFLNYVENGTRYNSGTDLYLTKFSANGTQLLASTFIGDTLNDGVNSSPALNFNYGDFYRGEIQTDSLGNFYAVSCTYSSGFPVTAGSFQQVHGGGLDGCVLKMSPDLSTMIWGSFIGGSADDCAYSLILDDSLNVFVDGGTASINFPVTAGTIGPVYYGGVTDGFITKIKPDGSAIINSSFIGTNLYDQCYFVQRDTLGSIYLYGQSLGNFPVSPGVYSNVNSKQFLVRLTRGLETLQLSTVFGNGDVSVNLSPSAFLVDRCGNVYCSGWGGHILNNTPTFNMPLTANAIQSTNPDGYNFYFIVLSPFFQSLTYASYFGGPQSKEHVDGGTSRFDRNGIIYQSVCAGCGGFDDLPTGPDTSLVWSPYNLSSNCNNGTIKIDFDIRNTLAAFIANPRTGCDSITVSFTNNSVSAVSYEWDFGDTSAVSTVLSPTHSFTNPGTYIVRLIAYSPFCGVDTTYDTIRVYIPPVAAFTDTGTFCQNNLIQFINGSTFPATYLWRFGDGDSSSITNPLHAYSSGTYSVILYVTDSLGCKDTATHDVVIHPLPVASINYTIDTCELTGVFNGFPAGALSYAWDFGDTTFGTGQTTSHVYQQSGTYTVTLILTDANGCIDTNQVTVSVFTFAIADFNYTIDSCAFGVSFADSSFNVFANEWDFGDTTTLADTSFLPNPVYLYPDTGHYVVTLIINSGTACVDTISKIIVIAEPFAKARFIYTIDTCSLQVRFINQSINATTSKWIFDNVDSSTAVNSTYNYPKPGTYTVTLIVNEGNRCEDDTTMKINLDEHYFADYFIPNIFTPNGDGYNPRFIIRGLDFCDTYHIQIYNRWGELMYESDDILDGWDGTWSGKDVPDGVYFYIITGSRAHRTGTVTVKRRE